MNCKKENLRIDEFRMRIELLGIALDVVKGKE